MSRLGRKDGERFSASLLSVSADRKPEYNDHGKEPKVVSDLNLAANSIEQIHLFLLSQDDGPRQNMQQQDSLSDHNTQWNRLFSVSSQQPDRHRYHSEVGKVKRTVVVPPEVI